MAGKVGSNQLLDQSTLLFIGWDGSDSPCMETAVVASKVGRDQISVTGPVNFTIHRVGWLRFSMHGNCCCG